MHIHSMDQSLNRNMLSLCALVWSEGMFGSPFCRRRRRPPFAHEGKSTQHVS